MAAPDPTTVFRAPGTLIINPVNTTAPTYGGTILGVAHRSRLILQTVEDEIDAEEYGGEVVETLYRHRDVRALVLIRGWDNDAITTLFGNTTLPVSGKRLITEPGATHGAGDLGTSRAVKLLFAPQDARHPAWYLPRALPQLEETNELNWSIANELNLAAVFRGVRNAAGVTHQIGLLTDMTL